MLDLLHLNIIRFDSKSGGIDMGSMLIASMSCKRVRHEQDQTTFVEDGYR